MLKDNVLQIVSLFLYIGTLGEMAIQSEYHIVQRPRKWGLDQQVSQWETM